MKRSELNELHYIAAISNARSICELGILSHEQAGKVPHISIAMEEIQDRRAKVVVPGGYHLHKYANLYLCARNPMMYKRLDRHKELCVLRIDPRVLDLPKVVVTDENASSDYVRFAPAPAGLAIVNRRLTFARDWRHSDRIEYYRRKSAKCAEVLVPDCVHPKYLLGTHVSCEESLRVFGELGVSLEASVSPDLFFR